MMKLRYPILLSVLLSLMGICAMAVHAETANANVSKSLTLEVHSENASNIYWDSETIGPQKPILLSWRVNSTINGNAKVRVNWRLLDAEGKKVLDGGDRYDVSAGNYAAGRQLFMPKLRGAYLWVVQARVKLDGPDIEKTAALPFAVISRPQDSADPFLSVNTSALPNPRIGNLYQRIGARVWRSPVIDAHGNVLLGQEDQGVDRLAVLPAPNAADVDNWSIQVETLLRSHTMRSWEFASPGDVSLGDLFSRPGITEVVNDLQNASAQQPAISLQGLWPEKTSLPPGTNQFALQLPVPDSDVNSAARRRAILFAKTMVRDMGFSELALHEGDDVPTVAVPVSPRDSAAALMQNVVLAYAAGARGYTASINPHEATFQDVMEFQSSRDNVDQLVSWDRAAVFSATSNLLGNAQFVKELFSETPAVYCALFKNGNTSLAVLWSMQDEKGKFELRLPNAVLLDAYGNKTGEANSKGDLTVPLTHTPYYVQVNAAPEVLGKAMRAAAIKGMSSVRVQVLPVTQQIEEEKTGPLRVRLQNITPHPCSGVVTVDAPKSWELEHASQQFVLKPGQWRVYQFKVNKAKQQYNLQMRVKVRVNNGVTGNWTWKGAPPLATAVGLPSQSTFKIDGNLNDWKDAVWMKAQNGQFDRKAQVAASWDAQNLYIAARVREPRFVARSDNDAPYRFWNSDAIQLGFGWRDQPWMQPTGTSFRDTDYGLLLAPFDKTSNGAVQGRVLTLWSPTVPFAGTLDHERWGGAMKGAVCHIRFNASKGETTYEASIPLSALGGLDPASRAGTLSDQPIRFGWIAHTFDGIAVQWGENSGVYPWWGNSASFLPARKGYLAAQGMLGFSQEGNMGNPNAVIPPAKPVSPSRPQQSLPPPPINPAPPQNQVPSLPFPVPVQPIPPNLLPPAPPE